MYSPGEGRDESAFNLPAINFNRIPGCCTAWTPRRLSASPSSLSPMSAPTTVCFARASFERMSDFFLLPCAIAPPLPFLPSLASLTHTMPFTCGLRSPAPLPFFLFLQCLHMQSLPECAMSFLLGSAASFTVDWFLFRSRGNGPPPPPPFPIVPPSSPSSSFPPPGQAAGVGNGPDVRCMVDGSAAPAPRALGCRERDGAVLAVAVPVPRRLAPPTPPHPARSCGGRGESPPAASPASGSRGRGAHSCSGVGRTKPSCFRRGRFGPLGQICCAV